MIAYSTMVTEFQISPVLVWTVGVSVPFFMTYKALGGSMWLYVVIPDESPSSSVPLVSIVIPVLITSAFVSFPVLVIGIILLIVLRYCIRLVDRLIILSIF